jgi:hypothetical protein
MSSASASQPEHAGMSRPGRGRAQVPAKKPRPANKVSERKKKALALFEGPAPPPGLEEFCGELGYHETRARGVDESASMISWLAEDVAAGDLLLLWVVCPHGSGPTPEDLTILRDAAAAGAFVKIVEDRPGELPTPGAAGGRGESNECVERFRAFGLPHGLVDATPLCAGRAWALPTAWDEERKEADKLRRLVVEQVKRILPPAPTVAACGPRCAMEYDAGTAAWTEQVVQGPDATPEPQAWCLSAPEGAPGEFSQALIRLLRGRGGGRARGGMAWPTAAELLHRLRTQKCSAAARLSAIHGASAPSPLLMANKPMIWGTRLRFG